jgi:hypothetical protein
VVSREVPTKLFPPPSTYHKLGTGPPEEERQKETMRKMKNHTPGWRRERDS